MPLKLPAIALPTYKATVPGPNGAPIEVYKLADGALQKQLEEELANIPPGSLHAVVDVAKGPEEGTVTGMLAIKQRSDHPWSVAAGFAATFSGTWNAGLRVRKDF